MVRAFLLAGLAAAASATVVVRQGAVQALDIGTKPFQLVGEGTNANCAKQISHGTVTQNAPNVPKNFQKFGVEGSINFNEINATSDLNQERQPCQKNGNMLLLSQDEINRQTNNAARDFLGVDDKALKKIFLAGVDTGNRRCGNFNANQKSNYAFTKEISAFEDRLKQDNINIKKELKASGDKWMFQYNPEQGTICVYVDTTATAFVKANKKGKGTVPVETPDATAGNGTSTDPSASDPTLADPNTEPTVPSESAEPEPSPDAGRVCFPGVATVETKDGFKQMSNVKIGDSVKVADGSFSDVFMFTHKMADAKHDFVVIKSASSELALTAGHYLYVNGNLAAASTVRVGDVIESATSPMTVTSVGSATMDGLYNPQTVHGDIIVNGVRASTFTTTVQPSAAQALLAPLRAAYAKLGFVTAFLDQGSDCMAPSGPAVMA